MKTSNSSKHLNGDSMASHKARMKQTVEKDLSPPDSDRMSLAPSPSELVGWTYKKKYHVKVITTKIFIKHTLLVGWTYRKCTT